MQFKCSSCGHKFESNNKDYVRCPQCQSDNVAPFKPSNSTKLLVMLIAVLGVAVLTFSVLKFIKTKSDSPKELEEEFVETSVPSITASVPEMHPDPDKVIPEPVSLQVTTPKYKNGTYSFTATCEHLAEGVKVKYLLKDSFEDKMFKESTSGIFTGVAPSSDEDGAYAVVLVDADSGKKLTSKIITGLIKVKVLKAKMPKNQLQDMINGKNNVLLTNHPSIVPMPNLTFSNLKSGEKKPVIFADIFQKFKMNMWESIVITNIGYNENNMINSVTMSVVYSDF